MQDWSSHQEQVRLATRVRQAWLAAPPAIVLTLGCRHSCCREPSTATLGLHGETLIPQRPLLSALDVHHSTALQRALGTQWLILLVSASQGGTLFLERPDSRCLKRLNAVKTCGSPVARAVQFAHDLRQLAVRSRGVDDGGQRPLGVPHQLQAILHHGCPALVLAALRIPSVGAPHGRLRRSLGSSLHDSGSV